MFLFTLMLVYRRVLLIESSPAKKNAVANQPNLAIVKYFTTTNYFLNISSHQLNKLDMYGLPPYHNKNWSGLIFKLDSHLISCAKQCGNSGEAHQTETGSISSDRQHRPAWVPVFLQRNMEMWINRPDRQWKYPQRKRDIGVDLNAKDLIQPHVCSICLFHTCFTWFNPDLQIVGLTTIVGSPMCRTHS